MVVNCDLVIANEAAKFGFPEVKRGVVAIQGGIPRLAQIAGHQVWLKPLKRKNRFFLPIICSRAHVTSESCLSCVRVML